MRRINRGSTDWTMGKLLAAVLAIALLVIVIFGWNDAIRPLYGRLKGKVSEVLILLNPWYDGDSSGVDASVVGGVDCYTRKLVDISNGPTLLDALGMEEKYKGFAEFKHCKNTVCFFHDKGPIGSYIWTGGKLYESNSEEETGNEVRVSSIDADLAKFYSDLYQAVWTLEDSGQSVQEFYDGRLSDQIIFYGNGEGYGGRVYAIWGNDHWLIKRYVPGTKGRSKSLGHGEIDYISGTSEYWKTINPGKNNNEAIDAFVEIVGDGNQDEVYFGFSSPVVKGNSGLGVYSSDDDSWAPISNIIGKDGDNLEIETTTEVNKLKAWVNEKGEQRIKKARSNTDLDKLKAAVDGEVLRIDEKNYNISYTGDEENPFVEMTSGDSKYRLSFNATVMIDNRFNKIESGSSNVRTFSANLEVFENGKWRILPANFAYYMSSSWFADQYKVDKIKEFLKVKCR